MSVDAEWVYAGSNPQVAVHRRVDVIPQNKREKQIEKGGKERNGGRRICFRRRVNVNRRNSFQATKDDDRLNDTATPSPIRDGLGSEIRNDSEEEA